MTAAALWDRLSAEGLVEGEMPEPERSASPWYVRVMLGIAGWIGALFLIAFVGAAFAFIMKDAASPPLVGAACCAGAFALFRAFDGNDFGRAVRPRRQPGRAGADRRRPGRNPRDGGSGPLSRRRRGGGRAWRWRCPISSTACWRRAAPRSRWRWRSTSCRCTAWPRRSCARAWPGCGWSRNGGPRAGRLWRPVGYGLVLALAAGRDVPPVRCGQWFSGRAESAGLDRASRPAVGPGLTAAVLVWVAAALTLREEGAWARAGSRPITVGAALIFGIALAEGAGPRLGPADPAARLRRRQPDPGGARDPEPARLRRAFLLQPARDPAREVRHIGGHRPAPARRMFALRRWLSPLRSRDGAPIMRKAVALVAGLAVLAFVNFGIYQREQLVTGGSIVLLEAGAGRSALADAGRLYAPRISRSPTRPSRWQRRSALADGQIVVGLDGRKASAISAASPTAGRSRPARSLCATGSAAASRTSRPTPISSRRGRRRPIADAAYGEFRVAADGEMILTGLRDARYALLQVKR